jgi:iron complex outermembrane receptor protein
MANKTSVREAVILFGIFVMWGIRPATVAASDATSDQSMSPKEAVAQVNQGAAESPSAMDKQSELQPAKEAATIEAVVVTAQKRQERLKDVPISISVLGGKDLEESSFQGVTDALETVPSLAATRTPQGGGTQVVLRGVGAGGPLFSGASPVAYYLDSAPFALTISAIAPDPNIYDLKQVEVLRGPQSTLYGANAENGVVRVLTNDANLYNFEFKARTLSSTTQGGDGNYGGDMAINVPIIDGKLGARAAVDYQNLSGWINRPTADHINNAELRNYRFKINAQPTDALSVGLSTWFVRDNYGGPSSSSSDRTVNSKVPEPLTTSYESYALKLGYELGDSSIWSAASYLHYLNTSVYDLGKANIGLPLGTPLYANLPAEMFSEETVFNSALGSSWHWTAGGFYRHEKDRTTAQIPEFGPPIGFEDGIDSYAAFGQIGWRFLSDEFDLTLGLRYYHDNLSSQNVQDKGFVAAPLDRVTTSFSGVTPRAALTWYPSSRLTVYGSYSEGFRAAAPQDPGIALPAAKSDKLHNYEFGAKGDLFDNRLSFDSALYYIKWTQIQQLITVPDNYGIPVAAIVNAQSASGVGVDFAVTARPTRALELGVTFGWSGLTIDGNVLSSGVILFNKGDRLNYSPEYTGGLSAKYTFPVSGGLSGRVTVSGNYSSRETDRNVNLGKTIVNTGDNLFDGRASFAVLWPTHWSATLYVDNFTNNYGATPAFGFPVAELRPRPRPRTAGLRAEYRH